MYKKSISLPKAWREVFAQVKEQYPDALMAGGCLRDLENHRPVKDIDIFVCNPNPKGEDDLYSSRNGIEEPVVLKGYTEDRDQAFESSDTPDNTLRGTTVFVSEDGLPVNIIYLKDGISPAERFKRFDYGFNQIGYDGDTVFATSEYSQDILNRCMTLRRIENFEQLKKSLQRAEKFQEKYTNWPVIIPGNLIGKFNELLGINKELVVTVNEGCGDFPF